jgi:uncharacterized repeat protein (TIGR01451 family)
MSLAVTPGRTVRAHRRLVASLVTLAAVLAGSVFAAAPAYAASTTDLTVSLTNTVDAVAGKRVTYRIVVTNTGPSKAKGVEITFTTSAKLRSIKYKISNGHCSHSPKKVPCHWYSSLRKGKSFTVIISGLMPKKMATGTAVTNSVVVDSRTKRVNTGNDRATDNYRLGIPRVTAPVIAPSPSINPTGNLAKFTNTAAKVADYSSHIMVWTFIILGAAAIWFAIGLALHHRRRAADADFDRNDPGDD